MVNTKESKITSLKERQREERTALILEAAYDVLSEKGYHEASMDEIAARVGIAKGTLYLHFKSKEDLIFMLIEQEIIKFLALIDPIVNEEGSIQNRLERILLVTYKSIQTGRHFLSALRSIGLNKGFIQERLKEQVSMAGLITRLVSLFEEGKTRGELDVTIPTPIIVSVFLGLLEPYSGEQDDVNQFTPEELAKSVSHLFFHGLLAKS